MKLPAWISAEHRSKGLPLLPHPERFRGWRRGLGRGGRLVPETETGQSRTIVHWPPAQGKSNRVAPMNINGRNGAKDIRAKQCSNAPRRDPPQLTCHVPL